MATSLSSKITLHMRAMGLRKKDDAFVVVYLRNRTTGETSDADWKEVFRSSTVKNNKNPEWSDAPEIDYRFEEVQEAKFEVYDRDAKSEKLKKHDFLGMTVTKVSKIVGARGGVFSAQLVSKKGKAGKRGKLIIRAQEVATTNDLFEFTLSGKKLAKKNGGLFGKSDPMYIFYQEQSTNEWIKVFEGEKIKSDVNPRWKPNRVPVAALCNGDRDKQIKVEIMDWESSGKHKLIGSFVASLNEIMDKRTFELTHPKAKKSPGTVEFESATIQERASFLEYIAGGCELKLAVAIDFTASNLPPTDEKSLHYMPPGFHFDGRVNQITKLNDYQRALIAIGEILQDYDSDQMIPAFGFGASGPEKQGMDMHAFPLTLNPKKVEVKGVKGLMAAYTEALKKVKLSGPTKFSGVIDYTLKTMETVTQAKQSYNILLILTDGMINDMNETIDLVIKASKLPLSIVIVGIGAADFDGMEVLDADSAKLTNGKDTAARDIVQFVPYSKLAGKSYTGLAEETLKEIPQQMEDFFRRNRMKPNPKVEAPKEHYAAVADEGDPSDDEAGAEGPVASIW